MNAGTGALLLLTCLLAAFPAGAAEGVVEINQARALAGGVTPGDAPGFPVTISATGSYRLTSNLDVRAQPSPQDVTAIVVSASGVTVDLGGFSILGPTECAEPFSFPNPSVSCKSTGGGRGVDAGDQRDVTVLNGNIRGMGSVGVAGGSSTRIENLHVRSNGWAGIVVSSGIVRGNVAAVNGAMGVYAGGQSLVEGNQLFANGGSGVLTYGGSLITRNTLWGNARYGIELPNGYASYGLNQIDSNFLGALYQEPGFVLLNVGQNSCGDTLCP